MEIVVYSLLWVMQDVYHQPYYKEILIIIITIIRSPKNVGSCRVQVGCGVVGLGLRAWSL